VFEEECSEEKAEFVIHDTKISYLEHSQDGKFLVSISTDATASIYDTTRKYQPVKQIFPDISTVQPGVAFSQDSTRLAYIGSSGVHLYDMLTLEQCGKASFKGFNVIQIMAAGPNFVVMARGLDPKLRFYVIEGEEFVLKHELQGITKQTPPGRFTVSDCHTFLLTAA
jgi:WD40 repeat protein